MVLTCSSSESTQAWSDNEYKVLLGQYLRASSPSTFATARTSLKFITSAAMQPLSTSRLLTSSLLLVSSPFILTSPTNIIPSPHDERGISDLLGNIDGGNLTNEVSNVIGDVNALIQSFATVIQELRNATNENDLLKLLGLDVNGVDDDDDQKVTNGTVGAVGQNATCPGMAVLFARGTAEPGTLLLRSCPFPTF